MRTLVHTLLAAMCAAALPLAVQAQATKPAAKPAVRPATKPVAKPVAKPAAKPVAKPTPAPRPAAPAPAPAPAPPARAAAAVRSGGPFDVGASALNLGIGLGNRYGYGGGLFGGNSSVTPAISLSFERGIIPLGPGVLGVGIFAGYQSASYEYSGYKDKYTDIIVMVRGAFHYPVTDQFDAYGGLGIGVRRLSYSSNYSGPYAIDYGATDVATGLFVGGRYFFASNFGAFAELGYDQTYLKIGLTAKF